MAKIEVNGSSLEMIEEGTGTPVVFVHGSASDYRTWEQSRDYFSNNYRIMVYSRRYHFPNESIADGTDYYMMDHVRDLEALLTKLDCVPTHLIGHSYGGFLCLLLAIQKPQLIRSLVLIEPPVITLFVSSTPKPLELLKLLVTRPRTAAALIRFGLGGVVPAVKAFQSGEAERGIRLYGQAVFGKDGFLRLSEGRKRQVMDNVTNVKAELLGSGFAPLDADQLRRIDLPMLLISGGDSIALFHHLTDRIRELMPHIKHVEIPSATHLVHEDNPPAFNQAVADFLKLVS